MINNLYEIQKKDTKATGELFTRAFADDPVWKAALPGIAFDKMAAFFQGPARYGLKYGTIIAPSEELEGAAMWVHSKYADMTFWRSVRSGSFLTALKLGTKNLERIMPIFTPLEEARRDSMKDREYIYLMIIGVDPEYQGKGYGKKLLAALLAESEQKKLPIYLETATQRNVSMYEKIGFKVIGKVVHPVINLPQWQMLREI